MKNQRKKYPEHIVHRKANNKKELLRHLLSHRNITPARCWEWTRRRDKDGYGTIQMRRGKTLVHRLAAHLFWGFNLARKTFVMHKCDNPPCFNPKHLFLGTNGDNVRDCLKKNRRPPYTKIGPEDVRQIRRLLKTMKSKDVAKLYGISENHTSNINTGKVWWYV